MSDDFLARVQRDGSNSLDQEAAEIIQGLLEERACLRRQLKDALICGLLVPKDEHEAAVSEAVREERERCAKMIDNLEMVKHLDARYAPNDGTSVLRKTEAEALAAAASVIRKEPDHD